MALKLIKVAKEFNVGLHTIVETLHGKGFTGVEEKPMADITDDMLAVLQKEFQKDLAIKQEADKLARPMLKKDPVAASGNVHTTVKTPEAPAAPARPSLRPPREEPAKATPPPTEEPKQEEPEAINRERPALRVIGKIDLDAPSKAPAPVEEPKQEAPKSNVPVRK